MANLISAEQDRERLRQMLLALEAKQRLVELLNAYVDGHQQEVRVVVGLDEASPAMQDLVLIGAPARLGGGESGHGGSDRAHAHSISGDDPGGELHCAAFRAHPGGSCRVGAGIPAATGRAAAVKVNLKTSTEGCSRTRKESSNKKTLTRFWENVLNHVEARKQN